MPCTLFTVDTHTAGEPTRIVVGGLPHIPGESMQAKKRALQMEFDWVRRSLMWEPRGHRDMFGAIITPPVNPQCAFGVVFMDAGGYLNMCGHGSIGVTTAASYLGWIDQRKLKEPLFIDTPAGVIEVEAAEENGQLRVGVANVPAFVTHPSLRITLPDSTSLSVSIAFGGSFFALVDAAQLGLSLSVAELPALVTLGLAVRTVINAELKMVHPTTPEISGVDLVEFYLSDPEQHRGRNVVVFGDGQIDRSPCGTGTCAKMALMHMKGLLRAGEAYRQVGILGTAFDGLITGETQVGSYTAISPKIFGSAYVTGTHQFIQDPADPFVHGFSLHA